MRTLLIDHVLTPRGWLSPGALVLDDAGLLVAVEAVEARAEWPAPVERLRGFAIPGLPNLHSHAFQRALAGLTERVVPGVEDSFWTWRTRMYALAEVLTPEDLEAIAAALYAEMLEAGMTSVGEFHYLHHDLGGARFADPAEMSARIFAARAQTGIALTHLPVLYLHGGFGVAPLPRQARFVSKDVDEFLRLFEACRAAARGTDVRVGLAPHSLRAVTLDELARALEAVRAFDVDAPVHIHVAEQEREVEEALAHLGARPVRALFDRFELDGRFTLVHATHVDEGERARLARSGAIAGLCPTTEANLGDGLFPAPEYLREGGRFGVGSDSQASVSATEELRLLEYGQRLTRRRRNVLAPPALEPDAGSEARSIGEALYRAAALGGARALGRAAGALEAGRVADLVVLDPEHPRLVGHGPRTVLDAWIFGGADGAVREVFVGGRSVVRGGAHIDRQTIRARFASTLRGLFERIDARF